MIIKYIKEKWLEFVLLFAGFIFGLCVYLLDGSYKMSESNVKYILSAWAFIFVFYVVIDFFYMKRRNKNFENYCKFNLSQHPDDIFYYPQDKEKAEIIHNLYMEREKERAEAETRAAEETDFLTRWLHDIKVPIAAIKLIMESNQANLTDTFYESLSKELFNVEESTLKVFYEMKSNRIFEDYKITKCETQKLISKALKSYSSYFSYKKLNLKIEGTEGFVLTDEKWAVYILSQIISNAVKYSNEGGDITIKTEILQNKTVISIKNTGEGISPDDIDYIFQKGYTAASQRIGMNSTGYGMYLCSKLAKLLGHQLSASSNPGESATFTVSFIKSDIIVR